jgi:prolyl oligopeptidase
VIAIDPARPNEWKSIIPQGDDVIDEVRIIDDQLVTVQMHDAHQLIKIYSLEGKFDHEIELPELGTVAGLSGFKHDGQMLYGFTSFSRPPTSYLYDFASGKSTVYTAPKPPFDPSVSRPSRCSIRRRTARRSRCSSSTRRA